MAVSTIQNRWVPGAGEGPVEGGSASGPYEGGGEVPAAASPATVSARKVGSSWSGGTSAAISAARSAEAAAARRVRRHSGQPGGHGPTIT